MANDEQAKAKDWAGLVSPSAMAKPNNKVKKLDALTFDPEIQQRIGGTDPAKVQEYADLIRDGVKFPRIKAVKEGDTFWVWDGFTRGEAYKLAGVTEVEIYYTIGTRRDAEFLSFSANNDHGQPRPNGTAGRIIEKILGDKAWGKVPTRAIAEHVGVGQRYVEKVIERLRAKGEPSALGGRSETRTVTRGDQTYEARPGGPKHKSKTGEERAGVDYADGGGGVAEYDASRTIADPPVERVTVDKLGNAIDREDVIDAFSRAGVLDDLLKQTRAIRKVVTDGLGKQKAKSNEGAAADPLFAFLYAPGAMGALAELTQCLEHARPYALCPAHAQDDVSRDGCSWCQSRGWLPKAQHEKASASLAAPDKKSA